MDCKNTFLLACATSALASSLPAGAVPKPSEDLLKLRILEAFADQPHPGVLIVFGEGFPTGADTQAVVCLGEEGAPLPHSVVDPTEIRASLPTSLPPGSYRLSVRAIPAGDPPLCPEPKEAPSANLDVFELTVGAAGAPGPQGERGPQGETGPRGETGPAGAAGAPGAPGSPGADGTSCTAVQGEGSATVQCTDGSSATVVDGAQGPEGPEGPPGPPGDANVAELEDFTCGLVDGNALVQGGVHPRPTFCDTRCTCAAAQDVASCAASGSTVVGTGSISMPQATCSSSGLCGTVSSTIPSIFAPFFGDFCDSDADCPSGTSCAIGALGVCTIPCTQSSECTSLEFTVTLTNLGGTDSATCTVDGPGTLIQPQERISILLNQGDAQLCVSQMEQASGAACSGP
jgi:hypothetical protein